MWIVFFIISALSFVFIPLSLPLLQGFFNILVDHIYATPVIVKYVKEIDTQGSELVCVSPDMGGVKRTRALAKQVGAPIAIIDKRRDKHNSADHQA